MKKGKIKKRRRYLEKYNGVLRCHLMGLHWQALQKLDEDERDIKCFMYDYEQPGADELNNGDEGYYYEVTFDDFESSDEDAGEEPKEEEGLINNAEINKLSKKIKKLEKNERQSERWFAYLEAHNNKLEELKELHRSALAGLNHSQAEIDSIMLVIERAKNENDKMHEEVYNEYKLPSSDEESDEEEDRIGKAEVDALGTMKWKQ
jgi:hypothetical protein